LLFRCVAVLGPSLRFPRVSNHRFSSASTRAALKCNTFAYPRWSSPCRCRSPRCDAIPQRLLARRRSSIAVRFPSIRSHAIAAHFSSIPMQTSAFPLLICARPRSAMPLFIHAHHIYANAGLALLCQGSSLRCKSAAYLLRSTPLLRRGGEDHSSRSSSSSQVKRPLPLFRHCPNPRS